MSSSPLTISPVVTLRQRESATAAMVRRIDDKIARLGSARRERLFAELDRLGVHRRIAGQKLRRCNP